jgi:MFS family permease
VSYFLSGVLTTAGITNQVTQANLFLIMNAVQIIISFLGCWFVDRLGRRPLLLFANFGCGLVWIAVTAASGVQASTKSRASSLTTVSFIYIFQAVYSFGWTPLQALYPVEVLSYEMRAKGMGFSGLFTSIGTLVNQFGFPVALQNIAWKTYIVFIIWCFVQTALIYMFFPETKNRTVSLAR